MCKTNLKHVNKMLRKNLFSTVHLNSLKVIINFPQNLFSLIIKKCFEIRVSQVMHISTPLIVLINLYI